MIPFYKRFTLVFLILLVLAIIGIYIAQLLFIINNHFLIDDAFIYARYARNVSLGYGFVWNPGEAPVSGFTSFLYMMVLIFVQKIGLSTVPVMPILGFMSSVLIFILSWFLGETLNPGHTLENLLSIVLIGLSPIFLFWGSNGMEMPLYTALLMISALSYLGYQHHKIPGWVVGGIFGLTTLCRPESLALFGFTIIFDGILKFSRQKKLFQKDTLIMAGAFIIIYAPMVIWEWIYFGYPFPNTYYAKTMGINSVQILGGLTYLLRNIIYYVFAAIGIPLILLIIKFRRITWDKTFAVERLYIAVLVLCSWGTIVINGGDHFSFGRFLMPTIPFLLVLIITVGYSNFLDNQVHYASIKPFYLLLPILISVINWQPWLYIFPPTFNTVVPLANPDKLEYLESLDTGFIVMGKTLQTIASENDLIAVVPIGAIGYYSGMKVFDMVGLVDPVIAHENFDPIYTATWNPGHDKGDGLYLLGKHPEYIQLVDFLTSQPLPGLNDLARQYKSIVEIWASPEFHDNYVFYPIKTEGGWYYNLYRRVDKITP